jgi:hypothetical protein
MAQYLFKGGKGEVGAARKGCMHLPDGPSVVKHNNQSLPCINSCTDWCPTNLIYTIIQKETSSTYVKESNI